MIKHSGCGFLAATAALIALCCAVTVCAQQNQDSLAFARAKHLQRGINTSQWFSQWAHDYSPLRLQAYTKADDIALIAALGFDHVRLSVDPLPLVEWQTHGAKATPFVTELDRAVKLILNDHLSVIIDIHPPDTSYKMQLRQGATAVTQFNDLWRALAAHYASSDSDHVFFEILNEPLQGDAASWQKIQSLVAHTIRSQAPQHSIIAAGDHVSNVDDLLAIAPIDLPNVIYTFHFYDPYPFTLQGAAWGSILIRPLREIPYPSSPEAMSSKIDQEPDLAGKWYLEQYGLDRWDAPRLAARIEYAAKWSQLHHVPIYCGEFGVLRQYADPAMRALWLHDVRLALEKNGIGWAMWDYQDAFGLVTKANGVTTPDPGVIKALGLHESAH